MFEGLEMCSGVPINMSKYMCCMFYIFQIDARMRQRYPGMPETETQEEDDEDDDVDSVVDEAEADATAAAVASTSTATAAGTVSSQKKKRKKKPDDGSYVTELQEALKRSADLQTQVATQIAGGGDNRSRERHQWGAWMSSSMQQINDSLWARWVQIAFFLIFSPCTQYSVHDST